ncbi:MAG: alpha/beta hydrolase [Rhodospirillales bacterium]|nr:alpha/beta hydrolase [Rhodospirillales bacterium]
MNFFDDFRLKSITTKRGVMRLRMAGNGPPLLLLHGNPQTHAMWHRVAPELAKSFTVICPDLCGYGKSFKPPCSADHAAYAKTAMAADIVDLMEQLGHPAFYLAAHDRGARVSHRLALDFPDRVLKLALLDIVPTIVHFERTDMDFAMGYYHWFWLAQPHPFPESLITCAPEAWFNAHTTREPKGAGFFDADALADYIDAINDPEMVRGMCEDYRAAATIDLEHDRASREAGHKIACPLLVLWGAKGKIGKWYDALDIWSQYSQGAVSGGAVDSGHYLAEEAPAAVLDHFKAFFG